MKSIRNFIQSIRQHFLRYEAASKPGQAMEPASLILAVQRSIQGSEKSWVLFRNGTIVVVMDPRDDLTTQATALMKEWGPVHAGSPSGDFNVCTLHNGLGWTILCHHPDILTFVGIDEVRAGMPELAIGLLGRSRRNSDATELHVIHVEDRRRNTDRRSVR